MAKKQTNTEVKGPQTETAVLEEAPVQQIKEKSTEPIWEMKDRFYYLSNNLSPLTCSIPTSGLFYWDESAGYEREVRYTRNQRTCFVDEMKGQVRLARVVFENGVLMVPRNMQTLQKFLSIYHPGNGNIFKERDEIQVASNQVEMLEMELLAMNSAVAMDIDMAEAVMRVESGSSVSEMSSKELKRDLLLYAKRNPRLFLELANDSNVQLRNFGIKATEMGIIKLSPDQRTFNWGSTDRKLMTVPFDEHPYSALAAWFKTDEGMEIYSNIEKRLK